MVSNSSDDNLKNALDDIFGNDFIEINLDSDNKIDNKNKKEKKAKRKKNKNNNKNGKKNIVIYIIIIIILLLLLILYNVLPSILSPKQKVTSCSFLASDKGYKVTDEYKITYLKNEIIYLDSKYVYTALNDEYKNQIEFVKEEKLPVIINSNGMNGFTYVYEEGEDFFSVNGYLELLNIDFNMVDKNNNDSNPISYIKIDSSTTYDKLIKKLEKNGYVCVNSK